MQQLVGTPDVDVPKVGVAAQGVRPSHERIDPRIARNAVEALKSHDLSAAVSVTVPGSLSLRSP